jgi:hypothetical protein
MGRAPHLGAPQRVSAHVVPKTHVFSSEDEDERTTIEAAWEEEASTTVEQGEASDKARAHGIEAARPNTNITSTSGAGMSDEPTVDDQRADAARAMLPPPIVARLMIMQGGDVGQQLDVRPGKTYTIGRGLDNDLVLTDIAVSRKHFDVRHDNGSWVLSDRGSGNGTLINHRIEDAPFMLASGDIIEIGNTGFRFEIASPISLAPDVPRPHHGAPRPAASAPTMLAGLPSDGSEPSTSAGKLRRGAAAPLASPPAMSSRPKTLPPPAPLLPRAHSLTNRPPAGYALERPGPTAQLQAQPPPSPAGTLAPTLAPSHGVASPIPPPLPSPTLAIPQMAGRPPLQPASLLEPPASAIGTTLPGQAPFMLPAPQPHPPRLPFSYPSAQGASRSSASSGPPAHMIVAALPRDATSTALVQPMRYPASRRLMIPPQPDAVIPPLSQRTKLVLGGASLAVFSAIATIAIIKGATGAAPAPRPGTAAKSAPPPGSAPRLVEPAGPSPRPSRASAPDTAPSKASDPVIAEPGATAIAAAPGTLSPPRTPTANAAAPPGSPSTPPSSPSTPPAAVLKAAPGALPAVAPTAAPAPTATPRQAPASPPAAQARHTDGASPTTPGASPAIATAEPEPPRLATPSDPTPRSEKRAKHAEAKKPERRKAEIERALSSPRPERKQPGRSTEDIRNDALALYRAKNFSGAAALISGSLASVSPDDAKDLRNLAAIYSQLGKSYSVGMAPGTKASDAYIALRRALDYDREFGAAFSGEIKEKLIDKASRAAMTYMAAKEYEAAFQAVRTSEAHGSTSSTNQAVRKNLEAVAADLMKAATSERASDPEGSNKKLRQILGIVDNKTPVHQRAARLLNGS